MKRKTKIFIGIAILAVCILTVCVVKTLEDAENSLVLNPSDNNPPPTINETVKTELTELVLKQNDLFEIEFDGFEGEANVFIKQKDIPELDERINLRVNELDMQINVSDESEGNKLSEEQREIRKLNVSYFCTYEGNKNLNNGDIISVKCDTEGLKKVNIIISDEYEVTVTGLASKKIEVIKPQEEEKIEQEEVDEAFFSYHDNDKFVWVYPDDIYKLSTDNLKETVEKVVIYVDTEEEFEYIKKKALNNEIRADEIQYKSIIYEKKDGYTSEHEWKGVSY